MSYISDGKVWQIMYDGFCNKCRDKGFWLGSTMKEKKWRKWQGQRQSTFDRKEEHGFKWQKQNWMWMELEEIWGGGPGKNDEGIIGFNRQWAVRKTKFSGRKVQWNIFGGQVTAKEVRVFVREWFERTL